jgi:putative endonuclease
MGSRATVALGIVGENLACAALAERGYEILARRYRTRSGEIDIVARDGGTLVFVEVKGRMSDRCGPPAEAVTWRKQRKIVAMARWYLTEHRLHGQLCRFDVVTVLFRAGKLPIIEVVPNAFQVGSP